MLEICRRREWKTGPLVIIAQQQDTVGICNDPTASFLWSSEHIKEQEIKLWFCLAATNLQNHLNMPWEVSCIPHRAETSHCWKVSRTHRLQHWSAEPPESGHGIVLTESQICLLCHFQCNCHFALMADAKVNWDIYTYLYMYFLCDSRWD